MDAKKEKQEERKERNEKSQIEKKYSREKKGVMCKCRELKKNNVLLKGK